MRCQRTPLVFCGVLSIHTLCQPVHCGILSHRWQQKRSQVQQGSTSDFTSQWSEFITGLLLLFSSNIARIVVAEFSCYGFTKNSFSLVIQKFVVFCHASDFLLKKEAFMISLRLGMANPAKSFVFWHGMSSPREKMNFNWGKQQVKTSWVGLC